MKAMNRSIIYGVLVFWFFLGVSCQTSKPVLKTTSFNISTGESSISKIYGHIQSIRVRSFGRFDGSLLHDETIIDSKFWTQTMNNGHSTLSLDLFIPVTSHYLELALNTANGIFFNVFELKDLGNESVNVILYKQLEKDPYTVFLSSLGWDPISQSASAINIQWSHETNYLKRYSFVPWIITNPRDRVYYNSIPTSNIMGFSFNNITQSPVQMKFIDVEAQNGVSYPLVVPISYITFYSGGSGGRLRNHSQFALDVSPMPFSQTAILSATYQNTADFTGFTNDKSSSSTTAPIPDRNIPMVTKLTNQYNSTTKNPTSIRITPTTKVNFDQGFSIAFMIKNLQPAAAAETTGTNPRSGYYYLFEIVGNSKKVRLAVDTKGSISLRKDDNTIVKQATAQNIESSENAIDGIKASWVLYTFTFENRNATVSLTAALAQAYITDHKPGKSLLLWKQTIMSTDTETINTLRVPIKFRLLYAPETTSGGSTKIRFAYGGSSSDEMYLSDILLFNSSVMSSSMPNVLTNTYYGQLVLIDPYYYLANIRNYLNKTPLVFE